MIFYVRFTGGLRYFNCCESEWASKTANTLENANKENDLKDCWLLRNDLSKMNALKDACMLKTMIVEGRKNVLKKKWNI